MTHMVIYKAADGNAAYQNAEALEDAARFVEQLRNQGQGMDARIYRMHEVPIEVKTYYKVEVQVSEEAAAPAAAPAAEAPAPAPAPTATAAPAAVATSGPAASKAEHAAAGANGAGGRFGLFNKG